MDRRNFLKGLGLGALAAGLPGACRAIPPAGGKRRRPNVLFISIDDLNDWVGCLGGHPDTLTPNLDRLAAEGVLFTKAYCAAPLCNPSRAALLTGIRPNVSGVYLNPQPWRRSPVLKKALTLPQYFRKHGYKAIGAGKIFHGAFPDPPSWDEYWPSQRKNKPDDPMPKGRPLNGIPKTGHFDWGPVDAPSSRMGDSRVADWVIAQLGKKHEKPLFLGCGFFRPHLPWYVPPKYFKKFPLKKIHLPVVNEHDLDDVPPAAVKIARPRGDHAKVVKYHQWKKAVQGYLASIHFADECLGRVLDALEKREDKDEWVVVLWSDHGWHLGEKLHWRKFALWEEATHNVLMVVAPGVTRPGGRCDEPVSLMDVYPTLVDLCGLPPKPGLQGTSLLPQLKNPKAPRAFPVLTTFGRGNHSLRSRDWRYIRYADGSEELYHDALDPLEWKNLAKDPEYAEVKARLARFLPKVNAPLSPGGRRGRRRRRRK